MAIFVRLTPYDKLNTYSEFIGFFYPRSRVSAKNLKLVEDLTVAKERWVFLLGGFPREYPQSHGFISAFTGVTSSNGFNNLGKVSLSY